LVVADSQSASVSVYLGNSNGTYSAPVNVSTLDGAGFGEGPVSVVLADVLGNGRLDIVTANSTDNTVSVLLNDGTGNFAQAVTFKVGLNPTGIVAADFNHDGKIDLAVSHNGT